MWARRTLCLLLVCATCTPTPSSAYPPPRDMERGTSLETNEAIIDPALAVGWVIVVPADSVSRPIVLTPSETRLLLSGPGETSALQSNSLHQPDEDEEAASARSLVHKRACNTATCATQRLMDFLSRARGMEGAGPTDTGASTFGRRRR
ncbi:calcitonin gene-related peptide 2-like isoform X2 [Lethenteron reissneri]|uniref:calcitonin gene-related peptide 2-like isoform X2 n=1 Tax=Lethenteron reissneri TaxID=7753 RepID=UPI002AB78A35|nr:calcitonin gene-related peptide 2-like isoform X2 [Lethenteron reissneri]